MKPRIRLAVAALAAVLLLAAGPAADAADEHPTDAWITTSANIALLTTPGLSATEIDVNTAEGLVTLHGSVPTEAQKRFAADVVAKVEGVSSVQNLLEVVAPTREHLVEASDEHIAMDIEKKLAELELAEGTDIELASVTAGDVFLTGYAAELGDVLAAIEAAYELPGVKRVASEIETPMPRSEP